MKIETIRRHLVHGAIEYDRRQARRRDWSLYALPQYLQRIDEVCADIEAGAEAREAILAGFCGRLANHMLRAAKLPKANASEANSGPLCYQPIKNK